MRSPDARREGRGVGDTTTATRNARRQTSGGSPRSRRRTGGAPPLPLAKTHANPSARHPCPGGRCVSVSRSPGRATQPPRRTRVSESFAHSYETSASLSEPRHSAPSSRSPLSSRSHGSTMSHPRKPWQPSTPTDRERHAAKDRLTIPSREDREPTNTLSVKHRVAQS
jgi:hypothetical protein